MLRLRNHFKWLVPLMPVAALVAISLCVVRCFVSYYTCSFSRNNANVCETLVRFIEPNPIPFMLSACDTRSIPSKFPIKNASTKKKKLHSLQMALNTAHSSCTLAVLSYMVPFPNTLTPFQRNIRSARKYWAPATRSNSI